MKKNIIHFLSAFVTVLLLFVVAVSVNNEAEEPIGVYASAAVVQSGTSGSISWTLDDAGLLTISGTGDMENVTSASAVPWYDYKDSIKEVVVEEGVTGISIYSFRGYDITKITLSSTVTDFRVGNAAGFYTFDDCLLLEEINVHKDNTVYSSENGVFYNKDKTELIAYPIGKTDISFTVPYGVKIIGSYSFEHCKYLEQISFPDTLTEISWNAFYNTSLKKAVIPDSVTTIESGAFANCFGLTEVKLSEALTTLDKEVFRYCTQLEDITIPASVSSISSSAFGFCFSLSAISVDAGNENYISVDGVLYNKEKDTLCIYPAGKEDKAFSIPDGVISLAEYSFVDNSELKEIFIPASVTDIGAYFLYSYRSLEVINVDENNVNFISVDNVLYNAEMTKLYAYPCARKATVFFIPETVTEFDRELFNHTQYLKTIIISNMDGTSFPDIISINCYSVTEIIFSAAVTEINANYVSNRKNITTITILNSDCSITNADRLSGKTIKGYAGSAVEEAFVETTNTFVEIMNHGKCGEELVWILDETNTLVIEGTGEMSTYSTSSNVPWAEYKTAIASVQLSDEMISLSNYVFSGFSNLTSIEIPAKVTSVTGHAFDDCYSLAEINVSSENEAYISENGIVYNKDKTKLVIYPLGKKEKSFTVPDGVNSIYPGAFNANNTLTEINLPATFSEISYNPFSGCHLLSAINVADGNEKYLSEDGIMYNAAKTKLYVYPSAKTNAVFFLPETVFSFDYYAMSNVRCLETIVFASNINSSDTMALLAPFRSCKSLTEAIFLDSVMQIPKNLLKSCDTLETVTVLNVNCNIDEKIVNKNITVRGYKNSTAETFSEYTGTLPGGIDTANHTFEPIVDHGWCGEELFWIYDENNTLSVEGRGEMENFSGYSSVPWAEYRNEITAVSLSEELTNISGFAFYGCSALESISMPLTVTSIGSFSFMDCSSLREIEMPLYLERLGSGCFNGCSSLEGIELPVDVNTIESNAFLRCTSLKSIAVDESNSYYSSADGVLYNKEGTELICYPAGKSDTAFTLPDTVLDITPSAFAYCDSIERINISYNSPLETIGAMAFYGCEKLNYFFIPANVSSITRGAFDMCTSLEKIDVHYGNEIYFSYMGVLCKNNPDDPEEITASIVCCPSALTDEYGNRAESFVVPYFVYKIEQGAFYRCVDLRVITFTNNYLDSSPFSLGSVTDSEESGYNLKTIEKSAFSYCEGLEKIILPEGLEVIGEMAFLDCASLEDIYIPESVTSVGQFAFSGCTRLKAIVVFSRDCTLSSLQTSEGSAVYYGYEGSTVQELTQSSGKPFKAILENEGFSYFSGVLHITASELVSQGDDKYIYPWSRYAHDTEAIFLENVSFVDKNLFNGFTEVEVIVITGESIQLDVAAFTDCKKLRFVFADADIDILSDDDNNAYIGDIFDCIIFTDSDNSYEGRNKSTSMEYSDGILSFENIDIDITDNEFFNMIFGICILYDDVVSLRFPQLTVTGIVFEDKETGISSADTVRYTNIEIEVSYSEDGEEYIPISFNDFCILSYGDFPVISKFTISDIEFDGEEPEEEKSFIVMVEEYIQYFLDAIAILFNKILRFFGKK